LTATRRITHLDADPQDGAERFAHIKRLIVVADRGLLSLDNMEELGKVKLPSGQALEFILAVPGRRYGEFVDVTRLPEQSGTAKEEVIDETLWNHAPGDCPQPGAGKGANAHCAARITQLQAKAQQWAGKLDGQDAGDTGRGRKLSDSGAKARLYHEVCEAHLARIIKVDLKTELFSYTIDEAAQSQAEMMDGKLLLVTNVPDLKPAEVVARYKALADIERGFRVLKSEIEIAPVYHRLPERIRAHAMLCFMALIVYRVMRQRLKLAKSDLSPERAWRSCAAFSVTVCASMVPPHLRCLHHQYPAVQSVRRTEPEKTDPRCPVKPFVVADLTTALYESMLYVSWCRTRADGETRPSG
jgi:hypothetical protein